MQYTSPNNEPLTAISVNGVHIGVIQQGDLSQPQHTLVFLHGFTGSAHAWDHLLHQFTLPGMRFIALDMLGHGVSAAPTDARRYTIEHCQADILSVLQALAVEPGTATLLGYSMGGRIALYSAFSGYFRALILESASPGLATAEERIQRQQSDQALAERIKHDGVEAFVNYWEKLPLFASQNNLPAENRRALRTQRLNNRAIGLANSLIGVGTGTQPALHEQLAELDIPVMLIAGELDKKFCTIAQEMEQLLPHAQLHIIPAAGHTVHLEQPEAFLALVQQFCKTPSHQA